VMFLVPAQLHNFELMLPLLSPPALGSTTCSLPVASHFVSISYFFSYHCVFHNLPLLYNNADQMFCVRFRPYFNFSKNGLVICKVSKNLRGCKGQTCPTTERLFASVGLFEFMCEITG
jgi:hypothetical protein